MSRQTDVTPANCYLDATATICTRLLWLNFEHILVTNTYKMNHHMHREMVDVSYSTFCIGKYYFWVVNYTYNVNFHMSHSIRDEKICEIRPTYFLQNLFTF